MKLSRFLPAIIGVGLLGALGWASPASAQSATYPAAKPIRILVGATPGGSADIGARLLASKLGERLGQTIVIENKAGAAGTIAAAEVARADPDGHTLLFTASWHATTAAMKKKLPYDPLNDFTFISTFTTYGMVLAVRPESPFKSLKELIAHAKANPRGLSYYSVGIGSAHHLFGESLIASSGAELVHVPYKGSAGAFPDFLGGRIDIMIDTMTFALEQVKSGSARALAVSTEEPHPDLRDVPIASEAIPGFVYESWLGLLGPRNLPAPVTERLNREVREIVQLPDIAKRLRELGATPRANGSEAFRARVEGEIGKFKRVVEIRNIPLQ